MIKIREAVIVEGKYDKIKLSNFLDALIVETNGFGIYKDKERLAFIRRLAKERGIILLTDSDHSGFQIRNSGPFGRIIRDSLHCRKINI